MARALFIKTEEWEGEETSLTAYNRELRYFEDWLMLMELNVREFGDGHWKNYRSYRNADGRRMGPKAERKALSSIRWWLRNNDHEDHPIFAVPWPKWNRKPGRTLTVSQRDTLLGACEELRPPMAARNRAIIRFLWDCDPRKFELAKALLENLNLGDRWILLLTKARPLKGRDWEYKVFSPATARAIDEWLAARDQLANPGCRALFVSQTGEALTNEGVSDIFKRLSKRTGIKVSPHDFRRGGGSHAVESGVPDRLIMLQMGLKSHANFQDYTVLAKLKAFSKLMWENDD